MNITKGKVQSAQKVVIYGPEGIGKSTFASRFPNAIFIDIEGSTKQLDIARTDKPTSWAMLGSQLDYIKANAQLLGFKTVVIDTIDWAEQLCIDDICAKYQKKGIEDFGYGNGYVYEKEEFGRFLNGLEDLIDKGINVVLTAHAQLRKFSQPDEIGEYDRWELKLGKKTGSQISPLVKEWADMVLFANYKTFAVATDDSGKKFKAQGGQRVMYTEHHPCWDAKNRHGLESELPFDYAQIAHIFNDSSTQKEQSKKDTPQTEQPEAQPQEPQQEQSKATVSNGIPKALADLMTANNVSEGDIQMVVSMKGYFPQDTPIENYPPDFVNGVLIGAWDQVYGMIKEVNDIPF